MKFRLLAVLAAALLSLTACSSEKPADKPDPATKKSSAKLIETSPLTGLKLPDGRPNRPIVVTKIDNTASANPQHGVNEADLVVEELVEGGLTRLAAFFYTNTPSRVGPVRSARATDIGIVKPVNAQLVASGGAPKTTRRIKAAGIRFHSEDAGAKGFSSDPSKSRPYNRTMNLKTLLKGKKATKIDRPYFTWATKSAKPAAATKTATSASVGFSPFTTTSWALKGDSWSRTNGISDKEFKADTMVVLFSKTADAGYRDPAGNSVPETVFVGSGRMALFHGNSVTEGTWSKKNLSSTITMKDKAGAPLKVQPGRVWIELVPKSGGSLSY